MTSRTCKTCRHWWPNSNSRKDCDKTAYWECGSPKIVRSYSFEDATVPDQARVECDEGWGIETGPDFGCIHWEKAEHGNLTTSPQNVK